MPLDPVVAIAALASLSGSPTAWTPESRPLDSRLLETDSAFYELLNAEYQQDPVAFGLLFAGKRRIATATFGFASLGGRVYEPSASASRIEILANGTWHPVAAFRRCDYSRIGAIAPVQGRGTAYWTFEFPPLDAEGVRLRADASAHGDPGYRCIALASLTARERPALGLKRNQLLGDRPVDSPDWLRKGANYLSPQTGVKVVKESPWTIVAWPRPMLVNAARFAGTTPASRIEYLTSAGWRPLQTEPAPKAERGSAIRFVPVSTLSLRFDRPPSQVTLDDEATSYFERVRLSRSDLFGSRFRDAARSDLAEMASYLLPIDFSMTALGRPADLHETMALWPGMFLMIDGGSGTYPRDGSPAPAQGLDRWFMPITDGRGWDADWQATQSTVIEGGLPAAVTQHRLPGLRFEQRLFVTSPDDPFYTNVAIVKVKNDSSEPRKTSFGYAMGLRPIWQPKWTPFLQDPWDPGYVLDGAGQTVRNGKGEVMLHSTVPGRWAGTAREPHFVVPLDLAPGETKTLTFAFPAVDAPVSRVPAFDASASWNRFKTWWERTLGAASISIPEARIDDVIRNMVAQSLIITLDGDEVRYGAYFYEAYFGIEEGWPAVALAQFGHAKEAKRIAEIMLSDVHMDKANDHHQYRNGLAPWYAITVARLLDDREWLRGLWPKLQAAADWTVAATAKNEHPEFGGILPRHIYGGDIGAPAYSFYSNVTCWRGLSDTAGAAEWLGMSSEAERYRVSAADYRNRLLALTDRLVDKSNGLPFLPMAFDIGAGDTHKDREPAYAFLATGSLPTDLWTYLGNYWNLFAPMLLEVRFFPPGDPRERWIPDYLERRGGILGGLIRFHLGYDGVYGKGYTESLLEHGRREEFLTAFYGLYGQMISGNGHAMPEVSQVFDLRTDNGTMYREYQRMRWNFFYRFAGPWLEGWQSQEGDPLAAGAGMLLQITRMALVREDYADAVPKRLRLLDGAAPEWFENGKRVAFQGINTLLGPASLECVATSRELRITVQVAKGVPFTLRLPTPKDAPVKAVRVAGKHATLSAQNEIESVGTGSPVEIVVEF
ncbi:MAG: hypothetical protein ACO1SV_17300 [Fimbriimonas sp.]